MYLGTQVQARNDDDFKQQIQTCKNLIPSGSRL